MELMQLPFGIVLLFHSGPERVANQISSNDRRKSMVFEVGVGDRGATLRVNKLSRTSIFGGSQMQLHCGVTHAGCCNNDSAQLATAQRI